MIRLPRPMPAPNVFDEDECVDERATACRIFAAPHKHREEISRFEFTAYGRAHRKAPVRDLGHGKCAYCESFYAATAKGDVEHYRPKGAITRDGRAFRDRGYYWLAAEWTNLLPSCGSCNSRQSQLMAEGPRTQMVGKGNEFPVADERKRARRPGQERQERALLLNPFGPVDVFRCLTFRDDGQVSPAPGPHRKSAEASIRVFGLQRLHLVREREKVANRVLYHLDHLGDAYGQWRDRNTDRNAARLSEEWAQIEALERDSAEYAAQARQVIARAIASKVRVEIEKAVSQHRAGRKGRVNPSAGLRRRLLQGSPRQPAATAGRRVRKT
jgi:hypothetical protein